MSLYCENCGKACEATIHTNDHVGSDCCEGYLLRRLTDSEADDVFAELVEEGQSEMTAADVARQNWLKNS